MEYKNESNGVVWMWAGHMKLLIVGGGNGRYHQSERLRKIDQRRSKSAIGELTSSNCALQWPITISGEGARDIGKGPDD